MLSALFWLAVGLVIGWNFLAQPAFVKVYVDKAISYITGLFVKADTPQEPPQANT